MEEYYFLFVLALIWCIFAVYVDLKKREVPNWLNFSLVGFALAYRAFYSLFSGDASYFLTGILGFGIFFGLAYGFYYARAFAGGDAKLLMGFGIILPYKDFFGLIEWGLVFIIGLFSLGAIYSVVYSFFIAYRRRKTLQKEIKNKIKKEKKILYLFGALLILMLFFYNAFNIIGILGIISLGILYFYIGALDKCMIVKIKASKLTEGDWIERDIRVGGRVIKKTVHGLSLEDIVLLKKAGKEVYIKEGIPFTPAFLFALIMVFFFLISGFLESWLPL
ncbi:MAG: A24 family peptidase [Nanoarchaeota archaeon]|nr:A24 family peptidase [Nanoarchaeota archaeon]